MFMSCKKILLFLFVSFALNLAYSQTLKVPYQFGFEEGDPEINNWKLNAGVRGEYCADQWVVGDLEYNEGSQSLYISLDGGKSAKYSSEPNVVVVSRVLELPGGHYDISFDWKNGGYKETSELYVFTLTEWEAEEFLESNDTIGYLSKSLTRKIQTIETVEGAYLAMSDRRTWINGSFQISVVDGRKIHLAFVWVNFNQDESIANPLGACIDNIQITSAMCPKPENLKADASCGEVKFSWDGNAPIYECGYKPLGSKYWVNEYGVNGEVDQPSHTFVNMPEGAYDLRVRAIIDNDTSAYVYLNSVVVWCPENHCFDYVSLDNKEIVKCEVGQITESGINFAPAAPSPSIGGYDANARHIACWVQGMYDPNTGNRLLTIPPGSLASVRLGNENAGAQAERITYEFEVLDDLVLLMQYAVVLEKPGHGKASDPYFGFEILKEDGTPISENASCGQASFHPEDEGARWEPYNPSPGVEFVWKDWTTIGVDLRECKGQKIRIRLTTQDCALTKHCGYAYFTLDCVDATIKTEGCERVTLEAPSGFKYNWYNNLGEPIPNKNGQKINVAARDGVEYFCDVKYLHDPTCGFTLSSAVTKQFPKAEFNYSWTPSNCNNYVSFENKSFVYSVDNEGKETVLEGKRCALYNWEFVLNGDTTRTDVVNPKFLMPNAGGELKVRLYAQLEDVACNDEWSMTINVDSIYPHNVDIDAKICFGEIYRLGNQVIGSSGTYVDTLYNIWGCDSIVTLDLLVREQIEDVVVYDTLCSIDPYIIGNHRFDTTGVYEVLLKTIEGCDSVVILHLEKASPIAANVSDDYKWVCADDEVLYVDYELVEGAREPFVYSVEFDALAIGAGFANVEEIVVDADNQRFEISLPDNCRPNAYTANILLKDTISTCGDVVLPINFDVYYSSSILAEKFGNMITVLNSEINGGYEFDMYRWYRNGELMPDENKAYYYLDGGVFGGECYYLEVRRADDGVVMRTCEICPGGGTPVDNIFSSEHYVVNTLVGIEQNIVIENLSDCVVNVYSIDGQLVDTHYFNSQDVVFRAPSVAGVYLLQVLTSSDMFVTKIIVNIK